MSDNELVPVFTCMTDVSGQLENMWAKCERSEIKVMGEVFFTQCGWRYCSYELNYNLHHGDKEKIDIQSDWNIDDLVMIEIERDLRNLSPSYTIGRYTQISGSTMDDLRGVEDFAENEAVFHVPRWIADNDRFMQKVVEAYVEDGITDVEWMIKELTRLNRETT